MDVIARTGIWDRRDRQDSQNNSKNRTPGTGEPERRALG
jgi:hypothetical protein